VKAQELKRVRLDKNWTQTDAARRLGMTQAYLNFLENGKRHLTPKLVRRVVSVYGLSPEGLPVAETFAPSNTDDKRLTELVAQLGYPGFLYVRGRSAKKNPSEVLLTALAQKSLDGRVAEALPWVAMEYAQSEPDSWLVENACRFSLQNRLGFVVTLAKRVAESRGDVSKVKALGLLEGLLDDSRLVKEDTFYRPPRTQSEREWLTKNRSRDAEHWNLLTDMKPEHLQYAG
jgi:transcriptional regulator with XRE-family HTH domain